MTLSEDLVGWTESGE